MQVNRYLKDKAFDHIDHALGRPVDPMCETYRNHYAVDADSAEGVEMAASPYWQDHGLAGRLRMLSVTTEGRKALASHLREIGDRNRLYTVSFDGFELPVVATTRAKARYKKWLEINDCYPDLSFRKFQSEARVRAA